MKSWGMLSAKYWVLASASKRRHNTLVTIMRACLTQVEALGGGSSTAVFVSVFSIANCLGRLASG